MLESNLGIDALRVLRPVVFAGAVEGPESLIACPKEGLENCLALLREGGFIEDIGLLVPTEAGIAALEAWFAADRAGLSDAERDAIIAEFRPLDLEVKRLSTAWQDAESSNDWDGRMAIIESLAKLQENTRSFAEAHSARLPRWMDFADRLQFALESVLDGDTDYIVSVKLPSYHTIWFEFHEDLLRTLERERDPE